MSAQLMEPEDTMSVLLQLNPVHAFSTHLLLRYILVLSIHLCLGFQNIFSWSFLTKILYVTYLNVCYISCHSQSSLIQLP